MREKWMGALRVVMMAGLSALICGVIVVLGIADYGIFNSWESREELAFVGFLAAVVVLVGLLTLGQLYGYLFAKWGWLSLRKTILVGVIAQALLLFSLADTSDPSLVDWYLKHWFYEEGLPWSQAREELLDRLSRIAHWIRKALITSPASIGLVLFYALHLRHKKQPLTTANA